MSVINSLTRVSAALPPFLIADKKHNADMLEEFRPVVGYENLYEVSNKGCVRSLGVCHKNSIGRVSKKPAMVLKQSTDSYGYKIVSLYDNAKGKIHKVHRLVAEAFIPNDEKKPCVDHINCDRTDNRVENLRWVTNFENVHNENTLKKLVKVCKDRGGANHQYSKRIARIDDNGEILDVYDTVNEAATMCGGSAVPISRAARGIQKSSAGHKWIFM